MSVYPLREQVIQSQVHSWLDKGVSWETAGVSQESADIEII